MPRTSGSAVQGILLQDYDTIVNPSLDPFIETANNLVNQVQARALTKGIILDDATLELIERWLSAHCYCCNDPTYLEKQTQNTLGRYMGTSGKGFEGSRYGQMALSLDVSGCLRGLNEGLIGQAFWMGRNPSKQTPYRFRR